MYRYATRSDRNVSLQTCSHGGLTAVTVAVHHISAQEIVFVWSANEAKITDPPVVQDVGKNVRKCVDIECVEFCGRDLRLGR